MNYLKEINAFYNELEINVISSSAITLWHALMHINNKCGWKDEFSVPVRTLTLKSGLSERMVSNARNELKTKGYIEFKSRGGNKAAVYKIRSLSEYNSDKRSDITSDNVSDKNSDGVSGNSSALIKHKHKQNIEAVPASENPFDFYQNHFGVVSPIEAQKIDEWIKDLNEGLVIESMKIAVSRNKLFFGYCESILRDWSKKGFTSVDDVKAQERKRKPQPSRKKSNFEVLEEYKKRQGIV